MLFAFSYWRVHHGLSVLGLNSSPLHMLVAVEVPLTARKGAFFFGAKQTNTVIFIYMFI